MAEEDEKAAEADGEAESLDTIESDEGDARKKGGIEAAIYKVFTRVRESVNKNALLAAILNAAFWGFGYFYNGRRRAFGLMLMTSELLALVWLYLNPSSRVLRVLSDPLVAFSAILFFIALAYDAYKDAIDEIEAGDHLQTES